MQLTIKRAAGMRLMLDLLVQLDPDRPGDVVIDVPDSAVVDEEDTGLPCGAVPVAGAVEDGEDDD